jgi:hypothetical protein
MIQTHEDRAHFTAKPVADIIKLLSEARIPDLVFTEDLLVSEYFL